MKDSIKQLAVFTIATTLAFPVLAGDYSTVNKSIRLDAGTSTHDVESVNGAIRIGDESFVRSVNSVNGSIDIGQSVTVERSVEAVNGSISLENGSEVGQGVETVNGRIELEGTHVAGNVETINGGIQLLDGSVVAGNVIVREPKGWGWSSSRNKPVKVEIGENVEVLGDLIFEHAVELRMHESAIYGDIVGDKVTVVDIN